MIYYSLENGHNEILRSVSSLYLSLSRTERGKNNNMRDGAGGEGGGGGGDGGDTICNVKSEKDQVGRLFH